MALDLSGLTQDQQFTKAAEFAGVPEAVLRGMWRVESGEGKHLRSAAGARGHFQTMPATQAVWEQRTGRKYNPDDFTDSLTLAALTMQENVNLTHGNVNDALRVYHGGTNRRNWGALTNAYPGKVGLPDSAPLERGPQDNMHTPQGADIAAAWRGDPIPGVKESALSSAAREHISTMQRGIGIEAGAVVAARGGSLDNVTSAVATVSRDVQAPTRFATAPAPIADFESQTETDRLIAETIGTHKADQERRSTLTKTDKFGAFFDTGITAATLRVFEDAGVNDPVPAGWKYDPKEWEKDSDDLEARERLWEVAYSPNELRKVRARLDQEEYNNRIIGDMTPNQQIMWGLGAGASDPVGFAAGFGVGKAFQIAGVGSGALLNAGRPGAAVLSAGVEGAVGNVAVDAGLVAFGEHRSAGDFVTDAAFGFGFGGLSTTGSVGKSYVSGIVSSMQDAGTRYNTDLLTKAKASLPENATADQIRTEMDRIETAELQSWVEAGMQDVPDEFRFFARPDVGPRAEAPVVTEEQPVPDRFVATVKEGEEFHFKVERGKIGERDTVVVNAVDESGEILKDSLGRPVANVIASPQGGSANVRVSPEYQRRGIATAMYQIAREQGADVGDNKTGVFADGSVSTRSDEGQAFRSGMDESSVSVKPLTEQVMRVEAAGKEKLPSYSVLRTKKQRDAVDAKYGLKARISDDSLRIQMREVLARTEVMAQRRGIDQKALHTVLEKAGLEATSTTLLSSPSHVARAIGTLLLENPEGSAGRYNASAAIDRAARNEAYLGKRPRLYDATFRLWRAQKKKSGPVADWISGHRMREEFDKEVRLYRELRFMGKDDPAVHAAVKRMAQELDGGYNRMASDMRFVGAVGSERLPEQFIEGYTQREWNGDMLSAMTPERRESFVSALMQQFETVGEMHGEDFLRAFAIKYLQRIEERAAGLVRAPDSLFSDDAADMLRDSLRGLAMNEADIQKVVSRYSRGGASFTKGRIDLDVTAEYRDTQGAFRLMDYLNNDVMGLYRRYAGRVAGDVALSKFGILGDSGIDVLRQAMRVTGANDKELAAFDQVMAEFLGRKVGDGDPTILANARALTSASMLGGGLFPQLGEYANGVPVVGASGVAEAIALAPRMRKEISAKLAGKSVANPILDSLGDIGGNEFGLAGYNLHGMSVIDTQASLYGAEKVGIVGEAVRYLSNTNRILSGQRLAHAVQTRGFAEVLTGTALRYIRDGGESKALRDIGISDELAARIKAELHLTAKYDANGKLMSFDPRKAGETLESRQAYQEFYRTMLRGTSQIIQGEFIGETGKWAHDGLLKFLFQFRTFSLIAQQKQLGRLIAVHGGTTAATVILASSAIAWPIHAVRVMLRAALMDDKEREEYLDRMLDPTAFGRATLNYVSAAGLLPDLFDVGTGVAGGWYENALDKKLPQWAKPNGGRTMAQTDLIGGQFAPALGMVNDAGQVAAGRVDKLSNILPYSRLPFVLPLLEGVTTHYKE